MGLGARRVDEAGMDQQMSALSAKQKQNLNLPVTSLDPSFLTSSQEAVTQSEI